MNVRRYVPRTGLENNRQPARSVDRALTADKTWALLLDRSEKLLQSYLRVLIFYAKWRNFVSDYQPKLRKYTANCTWTPVDVLREMAAQKEVLLEFGAAQELCDVTHELESYFAKKPTRLADKQLCALLLEEFCAVLTLDDPAEHHPVEEMEYRRRLVGEFRPLAEKARPWIYQVLLCADDFISMTANSETEDDISDSADGRSERTAEGGSGNATPRYVRSRGRLLTRGSAAARFLEDSARRDSTRIMPFAGDRFATRRAGTSSKHTSFRAIRALAGWDGLDAFQEAAMFETDEVAVDSNDPLADATLGTVTPARAPWACHLDEPSACSTPRPVKGTRMLYLADGSRRNISPPHVSVYEDDDDEFDTEENEPRKRVGVYTAVPSTVLDRIPLATHLDTRHRALKRSHSEADLDERRDGTAKKRNSTHQTTEW